MEINIKIDERELKELVVSHIQDAMDGAEVLPEDVEILVKSKQNYSSEWEKAEFKATYRKIT